MFSDFSAISALWLHSSLVFSIKRGGSEQYFSSASNIQCYKWVLRNLKTSMESGYKAEWDLQYKNIAWDSIGALNVNVFSTQALEHI